MLRLMCNSENLSLIELEFGVKVKAVLQGMLFWTFFQVVPFLENLHLMHKIWGKSEGKNILKCCYETLQKNKKKKNRIVCNTLLAGATASLAKQSEVWLG